MTRYNPQKIEESGTLTASFVSYQDELRQIWRDNVAVTKSLVLKQEQEQEGGDGVDGTREHYYFHQFITKIPDWDNNNNSSSGSNTTRNKSRGP